MRLPRGTRLALMLRVVIAMYVLAVALMPFAHHDVVCHVTSPSHCTTCVVGYSSDVAPEPDVLAAAGLHDAGAAMLDADIRLDAEPICAHSGRAPPAIL